jgi:hypothetical protein
MKKVLALFLVLIGGVALSSCITEDELLNLSKSQ